MEIEAPLADDEAVLEDDDTPIYMRSRQVSHHPISQRRAKPNDAHPPSQVLASTLEELLKTAPFETYTFLRGKAALGAGLMGRSQKSHVKPVGKFKGLVRIVDDASQPWPNDMQPQKLFRKTQLVVR